MNGLVFPRLSVGRMSQHIFSKREGEPELRGVLKKRSCFQREGSLRSSIKNCSGCPLDR
jgi:hypothetical protein